jgi:fumarate reductase flavoprotein subunit
MSGVQSSEDVDFDSEVPLLIVGAGAAGLCAALAASEAGIEPVVIERDAVPRGSTALSAGLIPAAGTRFQRAAGIADTPRLFADDIARKAHGEADGKLVRAVAENAGPTVEWLADNYAMPFEVVTNFNYPGHSAHRMHGLPSRTGAELIDRLRAAVEARDIPILTGRVCETLFADEDGFIEGVGLAGETIGCSALVLACNGYGGNAGLVRRHIPEMADALYFGHPGNRGDALLWGEALGARLGSLSGYQGHGSVATPHNILITWAAIMEGGFQVNREGRRFWNESVGYSEAAAQVLHQPERIAFDIFDARIADVARQFEDFRNAEKQGALIEADSLAALAARIGVPADALQEEFDAIELGKPDRFGRVIEKPLAPPYCAIKVTGALFHTQGGLAIDPQGRVLRRNGRPFPNLFAAGGAAAGVSGSQASGYLSGNGLLTATVLGRLAGQVAAQAAAQAAACERERVVS